VIPVSRDEILEAIGYVIRRDTRRRDDTDVPAENVGKAVGQR
jgi:hypothetical protein